MFECLVNQTFVKNCTVKAYLILLVLSGIGETRNDSGDTGCRCNFTGIDHNQQLHEVIIDLTTATLDDVDIFSSDRFANFHAVHQSKQF